MEGHTDMDTSRLKKVVGFGVISALVLLALSQVAATWSPCYLMNTDAGFNPVQYNLCIQNGRTAVNSMSSDFIKASGGTFSGTLKLNGGLVIGPAGQTAGISGTAGCYDMVGASADGGHWQICVGSDYNLSVTSTSNPAHSVVIQDNSDGGTNLVVRGAIIAQNPVQIVQAYPDAGVYDAGDPTAYTRISPQNGYSTFLFPMYVVLGCTRFNAIDADVFAIGFVDQAGATMRTDKFSLTTGSYEVPLSTIAVSVLSGHSVAAIDCAVSPATSNNNCRCIVYSTVY